MRFLSFQFFLELFLTFKLVLIVNLLLILQVLGCCIIEGSKSFQNKIVIRQGSFSILFEFNLGYCSLLLPFEERVRSAIVAAIGVD